MELPLKSPSRLFLIAWHFVAILMILLVPSQLKFGPLWRVDHREGAFFLILAALYVSSALALTFYTRNKHKLLLTELLFVFISLTGTFFFVLLIGHLPYSRTALFESMAIVAVGLTAPLLLENHYCNLLLFSFILVITLVSVLGIRASIVTAPRPSVETKIIPTSLYDLKATYFHNYLDVQNVPGGAISRFGENYLLGTGDGQLYFFSLKPTEHNLNIKQLAQRVPLNIADFARDVSNNKNINPGYFRTTDILIQDFGTTFRLFASHHHWNTNKKCFTLRVSALHGSYTEFVAQKTNEPWETIFDTVPCLRFKEKGFPFAGFQSGGRLALIDRNNLLLTVGDHEYDGVNSNEILPQDLHASYGKTILINLRSKTSRIYSIGHRNPQGLYVAQNGEIWLTEHGPVGGDELNHIFDGKNYGWPLVSYGTNYYQHNWPLNSQPGRQEGFQRPEFAWVPSIGVSNLLMLEGDLLKYWRGDLLVASLNNQSLWRLRRHDDHVVLTERIDIHVRIRDLIEDNDGRIIIWTNNNFEPPTEGEIVILEPNLDTELANTEQLPVNSKRGMLLFTRCSGCHQIANGESHGIGPDLRGIFQRRIATARGYNYSQAFKRLSGKWSENNLDEFLKNPKAFAPGTSMQVEGVTNQTERASLIAYLKTAK